MSWQTGTFATANAGELISILDTYLSGHGHWTTHDAAAGTNCKVYKCADPDGPCLFYLKVDDNYSAYAKIELWEGWDADAHAGTGASRTFVASATYYLAIARAAGAWVLSIHDNYFIFVNSTTAGYFIGRPTLFDESRNIVMACVHLGTARSAFNPISYSTQNGANSASWVFLFDENKSNAFCGGAVGAIQTATLSYVCLKDSLGNFHVPECLIVSRGAGLLIGTLPGVCNLGDYLHGLAEGDTVTIDGTQWFASIETHYALIRKT